MQKKATRRYQQRFRSIELHAMLLPGVIITIIFSYIPLLGSVMAFQDYNPVEGFLHSKWVGLDNFRFVMNLPGSFQILKNTVVIAFFKILGGLFVPITFALMLNEMRSAPAKRVYQTIIYMPHFLSWVILSGVFMDILSPSDGILNKFLASMGLKPIFFLGSTFWFPITMVVTDIWKGFGFGTVIYLAALTSIDPSLYESAKIDGAGKWKQTWHITLPGILPIIILMTVISIGNIFNAGFDQIYNLYSPSVYKTGDIIDTFIFRLGMEQQQYSASAAVGLLKSVVSFVFVSLSYFLADRLANYRIF